MTPNSIKDHLLKIFSGSYAFRRHVDNPLLVMEGTAHFAKERSDFIAYNENGFYWLEGEKKTFYQRRYFVFDANSLKILTKDHTLLHAIPLAQIEIREGESLGTSPGLFFHHTHFCRNDRYHLHFCAGGHKILTKYQIRGPAKDATIETVFEAV